MVTKSDFDKAIRKKDPNISDAHLDAAWAMYGSDMDAFLTHYGHLTI